MQTEYIFPGLILHTKAGHEAGQGARYCQVVSVARIWITARPVDTHTGEPYGVPVKIRAEHLEPVMDWHKLPGELIRAVDKSLSLNPRNSPKPA